jgi:hypothetical protein
MKWSTAALHQMEQMPVLAHRWLLRLSLTAARHLHFDLFSAARPCKNQPEATHQSFVHADHSDNWNSQTMPDKNPDLRYRLQEWQRRRWRK